MAKRRRPEDRWFDEVYTWHKPKKPKRRKRESHRKRKEVKLWLHITDPHCHYCRYRLSLKESTLDHKVPLSREGTNDITNLTLACYKCNHDKHDMTDLEYFDLLRNK